MFEAHNSISTPQTSEVPPRRDTRLRKINRRGGSRWHIGNHVSAVLAAKGFCQYSGEITDLRRITGISGHGNLAATNRSCPVITTKTSSTSIDAHYDLVFPTGSHGGANLPLLEIS